MGWWMERLPPLVSTYSYHLKESSPRIDHTGNKHVKLLTRRKIAPGVFWLLSFFNRMTSAVCELEKKNRLKDKVINVWSIRMDGPQRGYPR